MISKNFRICGIEIGFVLSIRYTDEIIEKNCGFVSSRFYQQYVFLRIRSSVWTACFVQYGDIYVKSKITRYGQNQWPSESKLKPCVFQQNEDNYKIIY